MNPLKHNSFLVAIDAVKKVKKFNVVVEHNYLHIIFTKDISNLNISGREYIMLVPDSIKDQSSDDIVAYARARIKAGKYSKLSTLLRNKVA